MSKDRTPASIARHKQNIVKHNERRLRNAMRLVKKAVELLEKAQFRDGKKRAFFSRIAHSATQDGADLPRLALQVFKQYPDEWFNAGMSLQNVLERYHSNKMQFTAEKRMARRIQRAHAKL